MSDAELAIYRGLLLSLQEELTTALKGLEEGVQPVSPDVSLGRLTRQDAMLSQQMALEMQRRNQGRLQQVEAALQRMARGEYGVCLRCDEEIADARLQVRPEAPTCIRCAERGR